MKYEVVYGDLLKLDEDVDAIVNSANAFMSCTRGVNEEIHRAAGEDFTSYCMNQGCLRLGECKVTPGFKLPYKSVIHVLSPVHKRVKEPKKELVNAYQNVCEMAERRKFKKIAFPLLSAGNHGYPKDLALECAKEALETYPSDELEVLLVLKDA